MLPSTSPREALLACPPFPPWILWSPPFPFHALALIFLFLAKMRLSFILTLSHLMIWCFGQTALFLFLCNSGSLSLSLSLCGPEATLFFSAGPVCSSFSSEACTILHALCWSAQHEQACHFSSLLLLSDSRSVLTSLSFPPSFLLPQALWQKLSSFPPVLSGNNGSPNTRFSRERRG